MVFKFKLLLNFDVLDNISFFHARVSPVGRHLTTCNHSIAAGTVGNEIAPAQIDRHQGSLYSFGSDHVIKQHLDQIDISNGLAWSLDNTIMYYIDSLARQVFAFDYDIATGSMC